MTEPRLSEYVTKHILPLYKNHHYYDCEPNLESLVAIDKARARFPLAKTLDTARYPDKRLYRYQMGMRHFPEAFKGTILDIGDRSGALTELVGRDVMTLDKNNKNLSEPFDWDKAPLPFADRSFDTVVCLDTLEHISDIRLAFFDLLRVSKNRVVVSLPNCWRKTLSDLIRGRGIRSSYGLPLVAPIDRHRWYFNVEDAEDFFYYHAVENGFEVTGETLHFAPEVWWHHVVLVLRPFIPEHYFKNLFVQTEIFELKRVR